MKTRILFAVALAALLLPGADLAELLSPDDVMLRRPAQRKAATAPSAAETEAAAKADVERRFQEAKARAEAEQRAREAAAQKAEAEAKARAEAEARAREEAARKAAQEKAAAEAKAREEAERKAEAEKAAREKAAHEAEVKRLRAQVQAAEAAREKAEAGKAVAEAKAEAERRAAEAAADKAARAEKRAAYLAHPDPDERPAPKKLTAGAPGPDVTEAPPAADGTTGARKAKRELTGRAAVITADRTDYDRKEGVILFDRNVSVDDEQYQMHAERLFVFLDGTNDMKRLVALGNVAITNEDKSAWCTKAVYTKAASRIVMYGDERHPAWLRDAGGKPGDASEVRGLRITYWIDSGLATVEKSVITLPGLKGANDPKDLFNPVGVRKSKQDE